MTGTATSEGSTSRTRRMVSGGILIVFALVAGLVVVSALRAEGRVASRADTNDGGAWLVNRTHGYVGHVNRVVAEVSKVVQVGTPGGVLDVDQADGVIIAHQDAPQGGEGLVNLVDDSNGIVMNQFPVPAGAEVRAVDGGAVVLSPDEALAWHVTTAELGAINELSEIDPVVQGDGPAVMAVLPERVVIGDTERVYLLDVADDGSAVDVTHGAEHQMSERLVGVTFVGSRVVLVDRTGDGALVHGDDVDDIDLGKDVGGEELVSSTLAQPVAGGDGVEFVTADGVLHRVGWSNDAQAEPLVELDGAEPLPSISFGGCSFTVVTQPATFQKVCGGETREREPLPGLTSESELRLKLVNGWVWINDLTTGAAWITDPERPLTQVADWEELINPDDEINEDLDDPTGRQDVVEDETREGDELDDVDVVNVDEENTDPVAVDDVGDDAAGTRADREILIDVLANDYDDDGDVLRVVDTELSPQADPDDGHRVMPTPDGSAVLFAPGPGFTGDVSFTYTIDDGRGGSDDAQVDVEVVEPTSNRPPETTTTVVATTPGNPVSVNVLDNDSDPDGDAMFLADIGLETELPYPGELIWDQSGRVVYTPDREVEEAEIRFAYEARDEHGESSEGVLRVLVRLDGTNNAPQARHDQATTVVGRSVSVEVLENDYDPDGDPLVAQGLTLVQPAGSSLEALEATLGADGTFTFRPEREGTYVFVYTASDGELADQALIRVDVTDPDENRPPVAVRDDVVIPRGGERMVSVLDNDSDPDGDVVGLVRNSDVAGLRIQEVYGTGYLVSVDADAPSQLEFTYTISDGFEEATAPVVVTVADGGDDDQPPVAVDDETEVRPGGTVEVPVLDNDFDPKGGRIEVVNATSNKSQGVTAVPTDDGGAVEVTAGANSPGGEVTYDIVDEMGNTAAARIQVRIVPDDQENRAPVARRDVARTRADVAVEIPVLANDYDPDGDAIIVDAVAEQPDHGTARVVEDSRIEYTPATGFTGTDRFTYSVIDEFGARAIGEVLVGVMPPVDNRPPQAVDDEFEVVAGHETVSLDVLANDTDPDGDELTVIGATDPNLGEVSIPSGGDAVAYQPPSSVDEPTETSFSYEISDGAGGRDRATVVVTVLDEPIAQPPVARNIVAGPVAAGGEISVDVFPHVSDPDTPVEELEITVDPDDEHTSYDAAEEQIVLNAGDESSRHNYEVADPDGLTDSGVITLIVVDNQPLVFQPMAFETNEGEEITMNLGELVDDPDGDTIYFGCCENRQGGGTSVDRRGPNQLVVTFTPNDGFVGQGGFTITADDEMGRPVDARVTVNVTAANRPPQASNTTAEVPAAGTMTVGLNQLASDPDGDPLTFEVDGPANGNVAISRDGPRVTIEAPANAQGANDTITYTATDPTGESATGTISVVVTAPDAPPPQAIPDSANGHQGQAITIPVLANDNDPLGEGLTIVGVGGTDAGRTQVNGDAVTFTSNDSFSGTATFTYTINDAAGREATGQVTVDIIGRPGPPPRPSAEAGSRQATVTWGTPSANGAQISSYEVRINGGDVRRYGVQNSATVDGLTNGQEYTFEVRAINEVGEGDWSPPSNQVLPDTQPGRPSAPQVEYGDGQLTVVWSEPANEGSAIIGYDLRISGGRNEVISLGNRTSYTWSGLSNGTTYTFAVRAENQTYTGDWSAESAPEHPNTTPDQPAAPAVQRGDGSLEICWTPPGDGGDSITQYQLQMRSNNATSSINSASCYTWHNLPQGEFQQFRVQARNRSGFGDWSGWSAEEKPCGTPDNPATPGATRGDQEATITWNAPNDQGCGITEYQIQTDGGSTHNGISPSARQYTYGNLTNGNDYRFRIRAVNEEGASGWSSYSSTVTPAGPPHRVSSCSATPGIGEVTITWNAPDDNGSSINNYRLWINGSARDVGNRTTYTATGLSNSTRYEFQVAAQNAVGVGDRSSTCSATTHGPPGSVRNLNTSLSNSNRTINVSWSAPSSDGGTNITRYEITGAPGGTATTTSTSRSFGGAEYDRTYTIRVRACNAVSCGSYTSTSVTPRDPNPASMSIRRGSRMNNGNCTSQNCHYVYVSASNLRPNTTFSTRCRGQRGDWGNGGGFTTNGSGNYSGNLSCYYGWPGEHVEIRATGGGDVHTASMTW